jgi:hypothetical protein
MTASFTFAPFATPPYSADYAAAVVPGELLPLFPYLMPAGWAHAPTQLRHVLYAGTELPGIPDVALVYLVPAPNNAPPNLGWVKQERATALEATHQDFLRVALHNVAQRPASWQVDDVAPGFRIAMCDNDYLAAERILDAAFLREAETRLGADSLLVGIPTRGVLVAAALTGTENDGLFARSIEMMFSEGRNKPLCKWPFLAREGRLVSVMEIA